MLAAAAGLGLALGAVTGMPLGVINVAIADAAAAGRRRFAIGLGLGGAAADAVHAALAFAGLGRVVTARPELVRGLAIAAAALIAGYAIHAFRVRPAGGPGGDDRSGERRADERRSGAAARGAATGALLTLPNPGALSAWVAVAAALWPGAGPAEAAALAAGVGAGSAAWFALLAHLVSRVPRDHRALRIVPRVALLALIGIAVYGVARAI
jgi:threonine/homoserine/homoserine lactone efflux protein